MAVRIDESEISGAVTVPPSKSYTHRAVICASLAQGRSAISNPLSSSDTEATLDVLGKLGVKIDKGVKWHIYGNEFSGPEEKLFCRESGTTLRFMTAVCSLVKGRCILTGSSALMKRPIKPMLDALRQLGVRCNLSGNSIIINNNFSGGYAKLAGNVSSQFLSGLLLISPFADSVKIHMTTKLESEPYARMTIGMQKHFGIRVENKGMREFCVERQDYKTTNITIEGDWSSAAFLLAAGAVAGKVKVSNLNNDSLQPDKNILAILKRMGANVTVGKNHAVAEKSRLNAIDVDVRDFPDLFPAVCALCAVAEGKSIITGIGRLGIKESNRAEAMKEGLKRMGIKVSSDRYKVAIQGSKPKGARINPHNDHRIAMAFAVLGLAAGETCIENPECAAKSFPEFWDYLGSLGAGVNKC